MVHDLTMNTPQHHADHFDKKEFHQWAQLAKSF
jgi:hypothetical protein